jgi:hypothetical protein
MVPVSPLARTATKPGPPVSRPATAREMLTMKSPAPDFSRKAPNRDEHEDVSRGNAGDRAEHRIVAVKRAEKNGFRRQAAEAEDARNILTPPDDVAERQGDQDRNDPPGCAAREFERAENAQDACQPIAPDQAYAAIVDRRLGIDDIDRGGGDGRAEGDVERPHSASAGPIGIDDRRDEDAEQDETGEVETVLRQRRDIAERVHPDVDSRNRDGDEECDQSHAASLEAGRAGMGHRFGAHGRPACCS